MTPWLTFDMDNTLMRSPYWRLHLRPWLKAHTRGPDYKTLWQTLREAGEDRWQRGDWTASFDWPDIVRSLGLPTLPDPLEPHPDEVRSLIIPGVEEALVHLRRLPLRLGLVTNGFLRFQLPYLRAVGWDRLFDSLVGPDVTGTAKPDPAMFATLTPGLAHVGDRLSHDVLVAKRAGRVGILVGELQPETDRLDRTAPPVVTPDFVLSDFEDLPSLIRQLLKTHSTRGDIGQESL